MKNYLIFDASGDPLIVSSVTLNLNSVDITPTAEQLRVLLFLVLKLIMVKVLLEQQQKNHSSSI